MTAADRLFESLRGVRIGGRYVVEEVLGRGGMGLVVSARYPELEQRVAIKLLLPELAENATLGARFLREARIAATLESPHLVRVFDVGRVDGGVPYMVMELLSGRDLGDEMKARGPLPVEEAVDVVLQACVGVAHVHAREIVHRDLKPSNLFLARGRGGALTVKVLDFGISKQASASPSAELTLTETFLGTPQYMSPEQVRDAKRTDPRTDVWSLGVILYEALTGEIPFKRQGDGVGELFGLILFADPVPPATHRPDLPAELERAIMRCLARDRDQRWSSVAELAAAIAPFSGASAHRVDDVRRALASLRPPAAEEVAPRRSNRPTVVEPTPEMGSVEAPDVLPRGRTLPVVAVASPREEALPLSPVTRPAGVPERMSPLVPIGVGVGAVGLAGALWLLGGSAPKPAAPPPAPESAIVRDEPPPPAAILPAILPPTVETPSAPPPAPRPPPRRMAAAPSASASAVAPAPTIRDRGI